MSDSDQVADGPPDRRAAPAHGAPTGLPEPSVPVVPLAHLLLRSAERSPSATAAVCRDDRVTYAELADRAWRFARSLAGLGVRPGDHVGILMPNGLDFLASVFGIAMIGAVVVPINTRYRSYELGFLINDARLVTILTTDVVDDYVDFVDLVSATLPGVAEAGDPCALELPGTPTLRSVVVLGARRAEGTVNQQLFEDREDLADARQLRTWCTGIQLRSVCTILYTSGTTAQPRGALLTNEALVRAWLEAGRRWRITAADRVWDPCPLFHLASYGPLIFIIANAATLVTDVFYRAGPALQLIERERATILYPAYPPITLALLNHPDFASRDLGSVRGWLNVAPPETLRQMQSALPRAIQLTVFGMTEVGPAAMPDFDDDLDTRVETCGRPLPGVEVAIVDPENGVAQPTMTPGEIVLRGYNCFSGYFGDPAKTSASIDAQGWFHSGDLGHEDEAGNITFLGRLKEMLKVGGENVAPAEIEAHVMTHPAVKLVQAVGVPDPRLVEVPAIFVELKPGATSSEDELIEFCRGRIASYRVPRYVRFVDDWPMSATKIQRFVLREQLIGELGLGAAARSEATPGP